MGIKKQNITRKILSVALRISGGIHHMIMIFGTHAENDDIFRCFFSFVQYLDFPGCYVGKRVKIAQNDRKFCAFYS